MDSDVLKVFPPSWMISPPPLDPDWVLDAQSLMSRLGKESGVWFGFRGYLSCDLARAAMDCVSG